MKNKNFLLACGCLAVFFPGSFVFGFPGVMAAKWQQLFNVDKAQVGQLMFFVLAGTGVSMYLVGKLLETTAPHRLIMFGNLVCALLVGLVGQATSITHIFIWGVAEGFFCGFVYLPCLSVYQKLFPDSKGLVAGILNMSFGGAAAIMSPVFSSLLASNGYEAACVITMVAAGIIGAVCSSSINVGKFYDAMDGKREPRLSLARTLSLKSFWYLWCVWALAGAAGVSLIMLSASFGQSLGYDVSQYVIILICFNILNGIGRLVCGRLSDYFPKQKLLMIVFLFASAAYCLMPFFQNLYVLSFLACFIGLAFGSLFTVSAPIVSDCFGVENFGRVFGLVFTAYGFLAGFLGPWLSGSILYHTGGNFTVVFAGFALFYLVSAFLILQVRKING